MTTTNNLDDVFIDVVYENNAQEVFKKLNDIDNQRDLLMSRWVWELIQNARGTAGSQSSLQIEVVLEHDQLIFRHNGACFKDREIAHLIFHGSSKHDPSDIGKFGSGFITTHLISRRVRVRGSLVDGRPFDFVLNRQGKDAAELREAMEKSKAEFQASLVKTSSSVPSPFTTEYSYPLNDLIREVVAKGIHSLKLSAAYIFAFNPMLQRLKISALDGSVDLTQEALEPISPNTRRMGLCENGGGTKQWLISLFEGDVVAAIAIESNNDSFAVRLPVGIPRLFVAFPLNSTENFFLPLVLNSEKFSPREERDGFYLGTSDNETNANNQKLFIVGCQSIVKLISMAAQQDWANAARATFISAFTTPPWANDDWLRSQVRDVLIDGFRNNPLLRTASGKTINPKSAWIPVSQNAATSQALWQVTEHLINAADFLPRAQDQGAWGQSLESWIAFLKPTDPKPKESWTIEKLAVHLETLKSVSGVTATLQTDKAAISWINEVHSLVIKAGCLESLRHRALIPNEKGDLVPLGRLHRDGGIDTRLKDLAELLGVSFRASLIHPGIITPEILAELNSLTEEKVLSQLLDLVRQRSRENPLQADIQKANVCLFTWLLEKNKTVHLDNYPVFSQQDSSNKTTLLHLRSNTVPTERWIAPVCLWPEAAKGFSDLFSDSLILHPDYAAACTEAMQWDKLATDGYLYLGPLFEAESKVSDFLPDEPLPDDEIKAKPHSEAPQMRTSIAFFAGDDRFVIDRSRGSEIRALKLIHFLLDYVLPADPKAFEEHAVNCDNGKEHRFYHAAWLSPLRNRTWIPIGKSKFPPSAESMASLLTKEPELLRRLSDARVSQFFKIIGANPADLMLRSVGRNDPERMSLIQSLAVIATATGNDPERVKALAGAIENDPTVLILVEERRNRQETIKRNQALGALVESLFEQSFLGTGLVANRTGPGHDYKIQPVEGEEDDAGRIELVGPQGSVFVEIKATTTNVARMSVKQVGEAISNKDRYFLCVVAVSNANLSVDDFKTKARFVLNIGELFQNLWREYVSMQNAVNQTPKYESGLAIELNDQQAKFRVDEAVWQAGVNFENVIIEFKSRLSQIKVGV